MKRSEWINKADGQLNKLYGVSIFVYLSLDTMDNLYDSGCDYKEVVQDVVDKCNLKRKN